MKKFKVIDPKGLSVNGKLHEKGETINGELKHPHISTALHFKQIEEVTPESNGKAKAEDEAAKKKAEAEAKSKDAK